MATWKETRKRLAGDKTRLLEYFQKENIEPPLIFTLNVSYLAVLLFRLSCYCHFKKWYMFERILWFLNLWLTGANISSSADIKEGLLINIPHGVTLSGRVGRNCTISGVSAIIQSLSTEDIGAGPGIPWVGDNVSIGFGATIIGPVTIGENSQIGHRCLIDKDLPENSNVVLGPPIKRIGKANK